MSSLGIFDLQLVGGWCNGIPWCNCEFCAIDAPWGHLAHEFVHFTQPEVTLDVIFVQFLKPGGSSDLNFCAIDEHRHKDALFLCAVRSRVCQPMKHACFFSIFGAERRSGSFRKGMRMREAFHVSCGER